MLTDPGADGHQHVANDLGVVHHDCLHGAVQHADLQGPLLLLVVQSVLRRIEVGGGVFRGGRVFGPKGHVGF